MSIGKASRAVRCGWQAARMARVKPPEPSLQPRSRGLPQPLAKQGSDWAVPRLYAPCYTARYLMFCQSPQTRSFAAALAPQIFHRITFFSAPKPQWFRGVRCRPGRGRLLGYSWETNCLADWAFCIQTIWFSLERWAGKTITASRIQPLFAVQHRLIVARQNREALAAAGVRCPEMLQGSTELCPVAAACSSGFLQNGPLRVAVSGGGLRYKLFQAAMAVAVA
ncbi:hypothetical protein DHEL01_v203373 [Diaporthe helianthi]|uniref:Uncharacterized protein n=1 Tax=Diaporthe helianthi TaxID=158607 RepID=A0A2P5I6X7_DIAHE|nr:hypothetical protein DHEL01_v203373 [Diaporthe helianthi]